MNAAPLPRRLRFAIIACMVVSGLVGMRSVQEAVSLPRLAELREDAKTREVPLAIGNRELAKAFLDAQLAALQPMRSSRTVLLAALCLASSLCFVGSARLLRPAGIPRDSMRRLVAGAALWAAVLRTLDGAQEAAVASHAAKATARIIAQVSGMDAETVAAAEALWPALMVGTMVAFTVLFAGGFAFFSQYFRSQRVKDQLRKQDGAI